MFLLSLFRTIIIKHQNIMAKLFNIEGSPFARTSAEDERSYLHEVFYKQQYYDELVDMAEASASRFILGQRGQGKSATLLHLFEDMKRMNLLPVLIDGYENFPLSKNENYFLYVMIQKLTFDLAEICLNDSKKKKKLNSTQEKQLALYIEIFYDPDVAAHCVEQASNIVSIRRWNKVRKFINKNLSFLNSIIGVGVKVGVDLIKSAGQWGNIDVSSFGGEYLCELELKSYRQLPMSVVTDWDTAKLKQMLWNLRDMALSMGYESVIIMFDKIDEVKDINGNIEKVTQFVSDFLTDTNLLYSEHMAIVMSIWSEIRRALSKNGIRFDKFRELDITWRNEELIKLIDKRLKYFSRDKTMALTLEKLVPDQIALDTILELADHSPRALMDLLSKILAEENRSETPIRQFSHEALSRGYMTYCKKFDYASAQPSRTGKGQDVVVWITRLLRLKLTRFKLDQYANYYSLKKNNTGAKHIETLIKYNLIKDSMLPIENDEPLYEVADPRIRYLISRGEQSLDIN